MSLTTTIPFLRLILPNKNLFTTILFNNSRFDRCTCHVWLTNFYIIAIRQEQDIFQFDLLTDFVRELFNGEAVPLFGAVLPATTFYNCVHVVPPKKTSTSKRMPVRKFVICLSSGREPRRERGL